MDVAFVAGAGQGRGATGRSRPIEDVQSVILRPQVQNVRSSIPHWQHYGMKRSARSRSNSA